MVKRDLEQGILVVDFGSPAALVVARRVREMGVYSEIWHWNDGRLKGLIEDGGVGEPRCCGMVLVGADEESRLSGQREIQALLKTSIPVLRDDRGQKERLRQFVFEECGARGKWTMENFIESSVEAIGAQVGPEGAVICGLSGGVDSSVVAALLHRAIGDRLTCVFVDNGLLRHREAEQVKEVFEGHFGVDLRVIDASERFLSRLSGVEDPERKRKLIGETFVEVFEEVAATIEGAKFLAQGTLYPDVYESVSADGTVAKVKTHHNVGGLPERLNFELIEPLRELFKDEVRELGRALGLPEVMVGRHPFPGPGLGIRVLGAVSKARVERLQAADHIFIEALREAGLYDRVWQAFAVLLPVQTVGVTDERRTYDEVVALRAVVSRDGMKAERADLPMEFLTEVADRIIRQVSGVNRVVYDVTNKPPATIEWE